MTHPVGTRLRAVGRGLRRTIVRGNEYEVVAVEGRWHTLVSLPDRTPVEGTWTCNTTQENPLWVVVFSTEPETQYLRVFIRKDDGRIHVPSVKYGTVQDALTNIDAGTRSIWDVYAVPLRAVAKLNEDGTIEEFNQQ